MHNQYLQSAFQAANHLPQFRDYMTGLKLHFRDNGMDITVKPLVKHFIGVKAVLKW